MSTPSNKGIDYSKWDRMDFSDDSDSDQDDNRGAGDGSNNSKQPQVTSLNQPGRVTINPDGTVEIGQSSRSQTRQLLPIKQEQKEKSKKTAITSSTNDDSNNNETAELAKKRRKIDQWHEALTRNGGKHYCDVQVTSTTDATNDATLTTKTIQCPIYWSQDRYAVTIRMGFPPSIFPSNSIRVKVTGALEYKDRNAAVGTNSMQCDDSGEQSYGSIEILSLTDISKSSFFASKTTESKTQSNISLLKGKIPRPIHLREDEEEITFEIEDNIEEELMEDKDNVQLSFTKFVTVTLPKAVPMEGLVLWWDCPLVGFPKIDTSNINDRSAKHGKSDEKSSDDKTISKGEEFQKAWEEAHAMFREKVKKKEVQYLEVDD